MSGVTVDHVRRRGIHRGPLQHLDLALVGGQQLVGRGVFTHGMRRRPLLVVDAVRRRKLVIASVSIRAVFSAGITSTADDGPLLARRLRAGTPQSPRDARACASERPECNHPVPPAGTRDSQDGDPAQPELNREPDHILIVREDRQPLAVLVRRHPVEPPASRIRRCSGLPHRRGDRTTACSTSSACAARRQQLSAARSRYAGGSPPTGRPEAARTGIALRIYLQDVADRARSPLAVPLGRDRQARSGSCVSTLLKLPLVPSTQPRASKRRPISISRCATSSKVAVTTTILPRPCNSRSPPREERIADSM